MTGPGAVVLRDIPEMACGVSQNYCPLLRLCPVCGYRFVTARGRRQHQNGCEGVLDLHVVSAQHVHRTLHHRRR